MADTNNHRIIKRNKSDLSFVSEVGVRGGGAGNDGHSVPNDLCTDGTYIYIADTGNNRVVKRRCDDLTYVTKATFTGGPNAICTDGTYLYVIYNSKNTISKVLRSDLSVVSSFGSSPQSNHALGIYHGEGVTTDGTYLYIGCRDAEWLLKYTVDFTFVAAIFRDDYAGESRSGVTDGTFLWFETSGAENDNVQYLVKRDCSDLASVWAVGGLGSGNTQWHGLRGSIGYDGTHLFVADVYNHRIKKLLASDGSFVAKIGTYTGEGSPANDTFKFPYAIATMGAPVSFPRVYGTIIG